MPGVGTMRTMTRHVVGGSTAARIARCVVVLVTLAIVACAQRTPGAAEASPRWTVVTLNLWHDKADWPKRQAFIVHALRTLDPDVVVLQEVLQHDTLDNQAATLAAALGWQYAFASVDPPDAVRRYGNAIVTRHRIVAHDERRLRPHDDYRIALHATIARLDDDDDDAVEVYATHLHHRDDGGEVRREQVADLLAHIDATAHAAATIVAGDFNTAADAPELAALTRRFRSAYDSVFPGLAPDAPAHVTLNPAMPHPPMRIDHVFFDPAAFTAVGAKRIFDAPMPGGGWASDHFGIVVTLERTLHSD